MVWVQKFWRWKIAKERCTLFSSCNLECDGYKISLKEGRSKNRILIGIYVNGWCKGEWFSKENENCPEIKFCKWWMVSF